MRKNPFDGRLTINTAVSHPGGAKRGCAVRKSSASHLTRTATMLGLSALTLTWSDRARAADPEVVHQERPLLVFGSTIHVDLWQFDQVGPAAREIGGVAVGATSGLGFALTPNVFVGTELGATVYLPA